MVKRYVAEEGSDNVHDAMERADGWFMCRVGFVETVRAVGLVAGRQATSAVVDEWPAFAIVEIDQTLVEHAGELAIDHRLRSIDSIHLAAALALPAEELTLATWDQRLHTAAGAVGLQRLPSSLEA